MGRVTQQEFEQVTAKRKEAMKELNKIRSKYQREQIKNRNRAFMSQVKHSGCLDCGELDFIVLEFDHRDPTTKSFSISDVGATVSMKRLKEELQKCDVVCSNCHRRRTAKYYNWPVKVA